LQGFHILSQELSYLALTRTRMYWVVPAEVAAVVR